MPRFLIPILLVTCFPLVTLAQPSDYIVLKKKNNRTLKTYFPGSFISAVTYTGFNLNGIIKEIKNDSVFIEQQEVRQIPTQFGVPALDTLVYTIRLHYQEIRGFSHGISRPGGGRGRSSGLLPSVLMAGGAGFIVLELVNTAYRGESLSDDNKLTLLAIAAGVAATGFLWKQLQKKANSGKKYKVIYVSMAPKKAF